MRVSFKLTGTALLFILRPFPNPLFPHIELRLKVHIAAADLIPAYALRVLDELPGNIYRGSDVDSGRLKLRELQDGFIPDKHPAWLRRKNAITVSIECGVTFWGRFFDHPVPA